jgi:hypothetical protein
LLGTWSRIFSDTASQENRFHRHPVDQATICHNLLFDTPFVHSSVAMRKTAFESVGGYSIDPERQPPEDFEFWSRICRRYKAANLPEVLLAYREVPGSMSRVLRDDFSSRMARISEENLSYWLEGTRYSDLAKSISTLYHLNSSGVSKSASFNDIEAAILHISKTIAVRFNGDKENSRLAVNAICRNLQRKYYLDRYSSVIGRIGVKAIFRLIGAIRA